MRAVSHAERAGEQVRTQTSRPAPLPLRGPCGRQKECGCGGREERFESLPTHLVLCDFRGDIYPRRVVGNLETPS